MRSTCLAGLLLSALLVAATPAAAVTSAELYQDRSYVYGRFEARVRFAPGDGVVSSFFLWKSGSEVPGTFWNELDFEKVGADCRLLTNPLYGAPVADHSQVAAIPGDLCGAYHTYSFEWTPTAIVWLVDGVERRRETGAVAAAFADNASAGMQMRFNIWPGDASFGGDFSPSILPVHQYIDWVQYSAYENGSFSLQWREEFDGATAPNGWLMGTWPSPKNNSTHSTTNVRYVDGIAILSLTADGATGYTGTPPADDAAGNGAGSSSGSDGCGCRLPVRSRSELGAGLLGFAFAALLALRRRGSRDS